MSARNHHAFVLNSVLAKALDRYADRTALVVNGHQVTYRELDRQSNALANELIARGIGLEDRVGLLLPNSLSYVISDLAVAKAGATRLPVNGMLTDDEIAYVLSDANARSVICDAEYADLVRNLSEESATLPGGIAVGASDGNLADTLESFEAVCNAGDASHRPDVSPVPGNDAAQFYTSGTTGRPKGVVHTHRSVVLNLHANATELDISSDDRQLLMTPLTHSAGVSLWSGLLRGTTAVIRDGFDADRTLVDIDRHGITWTYMVPTMIYRVLDQHNPNEHDLTSLRTLAYGSAPMSPSRLREAIGTFGPVFIQFYAQTEIPQIVTTLGKQEHEHAVESGQETLLTSAGTPCLMSDVRILDLETEEPLPPGEEGEIAATAPYRMREYYDRPEATQETLSDGWIRTGDIGKLDSKGFLYLLGRKNDMIVTGGMNVYPAEVEDTLSEHPAVGSAAVIGIPHDDWGEAVTAVVVPTEDLTESELLAYADEALADYKKPKRIEFINELPTTSYGKVDKQALREPYWGESQRDIN